MASPLYLDGPLHNQVHEIPDDVIEQGAYYYTPTDVYTFTNVALLGKIVTVASVTGGIPLLDTLAGALLSEAAKRAVTGVA